jgi:hypothetical protein
MPDDSAQLPALICHDAAFMQTWMHVTPEISVDGSQADLQLKFGTKTLVAIYSCRKKTWSLRSIQIRCGEHTAIFTSDELTKAMAALLGNEPAAPTLPAIKGTAGPRTNATLRERRTTVIRT